MSVHRSRKVDNANLPAKLSLRRYLLERFHRDGPINVLDCCCGQGIIWKQLQQEFPVGLYWGIDLKSSAGRLAIDSSRLLLSAELIAKYDVIDIDTYGSPWRHWRNLLLSVSRPLTVFLTEVAQTLNASKTAELKACGINFSREVPRALQAKLTEYMSRYMIDIAARKCGVRVCGAWEAAHSGRARYLALRIEPAR